MYFRYTSADIHRIKDANNQVANSLKIGYFDFDTLDNYYDYSKEVRASLMKLDSANQSKLARMREDYNNEIKKYNQASVAPTQLQQSTFQQKMEEMQTDYERVGADLGQQYQSESLRQIQQVRREIQKFLKEYCKEKGFAYVFGTQEIDNVVYYKDTIRNITRDLVDRLNEKFRNERKK
jgi:outer membrane protein